MHAGYAPIKRWRERSLAFAASIARSRGGAAVTSDASNSRAHAVTASTARSNAASLLFEGCVQPLNFRTNWSAEARISTSVAGGAKLWRVLMFRHMTGLIHRWKVNPGQ